MYREESPVSEDFINAKVRGMRSRLLEGERLRALADSRTLPELFRRIRPGTTTEAFRPFERELAADHVRELDTVQRFLSGSVFHLFQWLLLQYQLENVKVALRTHFSGGTRAEAEAVMLPLPPRLQLPMERLFETPDLRRFADHLHVSEFRIALMRESRVQQQEKLDFFRLEMTLDHLYNRKLMKLANGVDNWTRRLVGFDVDMRTLFLLLRARFNYRRDLNEVREVLSPSGRYLSFDSAERLFAASDLPDAINRLPQTLLPPEQRAGIATMMALEDALLLQLYRLATQCFAQSMLSLTTVVGYFYIKRIEFVNLIRATESVRHALPREDVEARLLMPPR